MAYLDAMGNLTLLKEYINQVLETGPEGGQQPFVIKGPVKKAKYTGGTYAIYREFPLVVPEGMLDAMRVTPDELVNGAVEGEHEILLNVDVYFYKSRFKGSYYQPPDPDEWEVQDWDVEAIDGFTLSKEDAVALKAYLGDLTDDEIEKIQETWYDEGRGEPPDPPSRDDFDDFDRY